MTDYRKLLIEARDIVLTFGLQSPERGDAADAISLISRTDAALAEKVEPVAHVIIYGGVRIAELLKPLPVGTKLYAAPAEQDRVDAERYRWLRIQEREHQMTTGNAPDYKILQTPKYVAAWCFNGDWYSLTVNAVSMPCWFHRTMQRWILGIHWRKL